MTDTGTSHVCVKMATSANSGESLPEAGQPAIQITETKSKGKDSTKLLGCLSKPEVLEPEDSETSRSTAMFLDPFRMSVLDFQHRALDKLAEILKIFLSKTAIKPLTEEKEEDLQSLLGCIKSNTKHFAAKLGYENKERELCEMCEALLHARNSFAHQKYMKGEITPQTADVVALQQSQVKKKKSEFKHLYKTTRTFEKTAMVINECIQLSQKVQHYLQQLQMDDKTREVNARCSDLQHVQDVFVEFTEYRDLERDNLQVFHQSHIQQNTSVQKEVALRVLEKLKFRIEAAGDLDLCELLACVVAPRCRLKIDVTNPTKKN